MRLSANILKNDVLKMVTKNLGIREILKLLIFNFYA